MCVSYTHPPSQNDSRSTYRKKSPAPDQTQRSNPDQGKEEVPEKQKVSEERKEVAEESVGAKRATEGFAKTPDGKED